MKLRNKKTGEIINSKEILTDEFIINLFSKNFNHFISELNKIQEEWEDYVPQEFNYRSEYIACYCPKCHKEIILHIRVKQSIPTLNYNSFVEICGE